jgi:hypothetical protein
LPAAVVEGQLFGLRLQALIDYMKGSLHASYSALEDFCHDVLNIEVAQSHLCNTIRRVNGYLPKTRPVQPAIHSKYSVGLLFPNFYSINSASGQHKDLNGQIFYLYREYPMN